jgi:hypothetical protein
VQSKPGCWAVGGFVGREEAEGLLGGCKGGTFVIRLSSEVGCLAITFVVGGGGGVMSVLVKPTREFVTGWEIGEGGRKYGSLGELIMGVDELKMVWPGVDKGEAFGKS